jgi:hypothetical protein
MCSTFSWIILHVSYGFPIFSYGNYGVSFILHRVFRVFFGSFPLDPFCGTGITRDAGGVKPICGTRPGTVGRAPAGAMGPVWRAPGRVDQQKEDIYILDGLFHGKSQPKMMI